MRVAVSAFAGSMAEVGVPQRPGANLEYAISLGALPPDAETVLLQRDYSDGEGNEVRVKTSPTMAQALGLSPGPQSIVELPRVLQEYVEVYAGVGAHAVVEISEDAPMLQEDSGAPQSTVLLVGYPDGRPVDVYELQSAMNSVLAPGWNVRTPFEAWARGAEYARQNGIWVTWAGAIGVSLAIASLWLQSWQHVAAASAAFARLGAFGGGARVVWLLTGARTAIPVIIGVGVGGALSTVVGVPLLAALGLNLAVLVAPIALTAALLVAAGLVAWILASSKAWRVMLTWRPGHSAVGID